VTSCGESRNAPKTEEEEEEEKEEDDDDDEENNLLSVTFILLRKTLKCEDHQLNL
jgi:hypothetical protein